jgi:hypothetical protein
MFTQLHSLVTRSHIIHSWESLEHVINCGGKEAIQQFWGRVDINGRNKDTIDGWTTGEEVALAESSCTLSCIEYCSRNSLSVHAEKARLHLEIMASLTLDDGQRTT